MTRKLIATWLPQRKPHNRRKAAAAKQKFYNSRTWRKLAKQVESNHPTCQQCKKKGIITDATGRKGATDHILPCFDAHNIFIEERAYDIENLQRLCTKCHAIKSGKEAHYKA